MPTSHPTKSPAPNWFLYPRHFELVAGLLIALVLLAVWYVSTIALGVARTDVHPPTISDKIKETSLKMANPDIQEEKFWHD
jgi:hypothetical protein